MREVKPHKNNCDGCARHSLLHISLHTQSLVGHPRIVHLHGVRHGGGGDRRHKKEELHVGGFGEQKKVDKKTATNVLTSSVRVSGRKFAYFVGGGLATAESTWDAFCARRSPLTSERIRHERLLLIGQPQNPRGTRKTWNFAPFAPNPIFQF